MSKRQTQIIFNKVLFLDNNRNYLVMDALRRVLSDIICKFSKVTKTSINFLQDQKNQFAHHFCLQNIQSIYL